MRRYLYAFIAFIIMTVSLSACGSGSVSGSPADGRLKIVATIFPGYDWVVNILGDKAEDAELTLLLDSGVDPHSYQPSAEDILTLSSCDVFIYVGGESDGWVSEALNKLSGRDMKLVNLMDVLGEAVKEEETIECMQSGEQGHGESGEGNGHSEAEYDEHVWLSLRNSAVFVSAIADSIKAADPDNAEIYGANAAAYTEKLIALDKKYQAAADDAAFSTLLFGDRFPFLYLADDYGIRYYAAFPGCSAETEASFETITFLAQKLDELSLPAVITVEKSDGRIAETVIQNTMSRDQKILALDSMQSVSSEDIINGASYLSIMESNLEILREALN